MFHDESARPECIFAVEVENGNKLIIFIELPLPLEPTQAAADFNAEIVVWKKNEI